MPTKKAATAAKARGKPIVPVGGASRSRPKTKGSNEDDDGLSLDDERPPPPKKRTTAAAAAPAAKKRRPKIESGSDIEMADDPQPPPKQKKATPTIKDADSDSADNLVRAVLEKGKGKAGQAQSSKRKS